MPEWLRCFSQHAIEESHLPLANLLQRTAIELNVEYEEASAIFHHALWHKHIYADLNQKLRLERPAHDFLMKF